MAKNEKTTTKRRGKATVRPASEPSSRDLIHKPDVTAVARLRFDCALFVQVTHPEYLPHEVMALVKQGEVQLDPLPPGQVGTLILNGFPYTVLGYYTFVEQDGDFQDGLREYSFHGPFYDFYRKEAATFQAMAQATGDEFEKARQTTRRLREKMAQSPDGRRKSSKPRRTPAKKDQ